MAQATATGYDPRAYEPLTFHDAAQRFRTGDDTPRDFLERCLATIEEREPVVQAFAHLNRDPARAAADASTERWAAGEPLSPIDGMPVGIKDLLETKDMPTEYGCEAFRGNFPKRDNAAVWALRQAGAVILGKTVTAELGGAHPGPTTNPFDPRRSPGGPRPARPPRSRRACSRRRLAPRSVVRSSGRPATAGTSLVNRGERQATSMSTHGVLAGCGGHVAGCERAARRRRSWLARTGGPATTPAPRKPERLIVLEGWDELDESSKEGFDPRSVAQGVELLRRRDNPLVESLAPSAKVCNAITGWENRWATRNLVDQLKPTQGGINRGDPRRGRRPCLPGRRRCRWTTIGRRCSRREGAQAGATRRWPDPPMRASSRLRRSSPVRAPRTSGSAIEPGTPLAPRPTGDPVFNFPSSMLFAPAVSMPLLSVGAMPVGVQVFGQPQQDAAMTAIARWLLGAVAPVVVDQR